MISVSFDCSIQRVFSAPLLTLLSLGILSTPATLRGESWRLTMQTGEKQNVWLVDEHLGVKMKMGEQPDLEILLRVDLQQTVWIDAKSGRYAVEPWNRGGAQRGGNPVVDPRAAQAIESADPAIQKLDPRARRAAQRKLAKRFGRVTDGQTGRPAMDYAPTGNTKQIGNFATREVAELANRQPTGRRFWVADQTGWEKLANALQQATDNFSQLSPQQRIPFKQLGGIPVMMIEPDGTTSQLVDMRSIRVVPDQLAPPPGAQQVDLATFIAQQGKAQQDIAQQGKAQQDIVQQGKAQQDIVQPRKK